MQAAFHRARALLACDWEIAPCVPAHACGPEATRVLRQRGTAPSLAEAQNGRMALARLEEFHPDAIVLDLMMPEMNGFELLDVMRRSPAWRDIPVVIVTARDLTAEDRSRLNGGVERIIQKSRLDDMLEELCDVLARCIERQRGEQPAEA